MNFNELKAMDQQCVANTYARFPVGIVDGKGAVCHDTEGREYIDFTSGIGVNSLGFCHDGWVAAVQKQAATLCHISNLYYTEPCAQLAKKLCTRTGCDKVFFANSGAEANEGVIKAARKYSTDRYAADRYEIITLVNSFHGRTVTTLSATGQDHFHTHFAPFTEGFVYAIANDIADLTAKVTDKTCAIMLEMIQGEGGVVPLQRAFTDAVASICAERDLLLIVDEVQTGVGRTGTFLACEQFGLSPDLVSLAKGLGSGLPIGAVLLYDKCKDTLGFGDHGTTFGGNPIACAGANVVMNTIDDAMLAEVRSKGDLIRTELGKMPRVSSITGLGLMIGVTFDGISGRAVADKCLDQGVIFLTAKEKLRMLPPLIISHDQLKQGLSVLNNLLQNWEDQ